MSSVTLFSLVEVKPADDEKFVQFFKEVQSFFSKQPGFISNHLYKNKTPSTARRYMVMGKWENNAALQAAVNSEDWKKLMAGCEMVLNPVPYEEVAVE